MSENHENRYQLRAAAKAFEWLRRSKPAVAAREQEKMSEGIALPPKTGLRSLFHAGHRSEQRKR